MTHETEIAANRRQFKIIRYILIGVVFCNGLGASSTKYIWKSNGPTSGHCYEVDNKTGGEQYASKVGYKKCKPEKTYFTWIGDPLKGKCYEVDRQTGGELYVRKDSFEKCVGEQKEYKWIENKCFVITESFAHPDKKEKCAPKETTIVWKPKQSLWGGTCYSVDLKTMGENYSKKEKTSLCRPQNVRYLWNKNSCYEVDAQNGPQAFSIRVKPNKCKSDSSYQWVETAPLEGSCFEISLGTDQKQIVIKVDDNKCRPKDVSIIWQSIERYKGRCLEVDKKEQGKNYASPVELNKCRPKEIKIVWADRCYEVDAKTVGFQYAKSVRKGMCQEAALEFNWLPKESGWGGSCYRGVKKTKMSFCRPPKIAHQWFAPTPFEGSCYEYDAENGNRAYSKKVASHFCKPHEDQLEYVFIKSADSFEGKCYQVDKKDPGRNYSVTVENKLCKKALLKRN